MLSKIGMQKAMSLCHQNGSFYCGYDNPRSIAAKGEWILKNGMKGMMFWDYEGDDTMGTLRKALWNAVMKK